MNDLPPLCPFDLRDREPAAARTSPLRWTRVTREPLSRAHHALAVLLPERFRAGCAFGGTMGTFTGSGTPPVLSPDKPCDG